MINGTIPNRLLLLVSTWRLFLVIIGNGQEIFATDFPSKSWKETAIEVLPEDAIRELEQNEMVLVDEGRLQVFSNYINLPNQQGVPFFVTADVVLHAFHVLLEESVVRIEFSNLRSLRTFLAGAVPAFDKGAKLLSAEEREFLSPARKKLSIILGAAAVLIGSDIEKWEVDSSIRDIIKEEVEKVIQAKETSMPTWLGDSRPEYLAIDYQEFKPSGPYQKSELLSNYFRAVKWLQTIQLWTDRDVDYMALGILAKGIYPPDEIRNMEGLPDSGLTTFKGLFGAKIAPDFTEVAELLLDGFSLDRDPFNKVNLTGSLLPLRSKLVKKLGESHQSSRSNLRLVEPPPNLIGIRFIPEYRLFDSNIFFHTAGLGSINNRKFPNGLELAAFSGSEFAKSVLREIWSGKIDDWLETNPQIGEGTGFYDEYWHTLSLLYKEIPANAPEVFRSKSWARKTCETTLASWVHMRYVASLHSELDVAFAAHIRGHPGFVEPNPQFFYALAQLCEFILELNEKRRFLVGDANAQATQMRILAGAVRERVGRKDVPGITEDQSQEVKWIGDYRLAINLLAEAGLSINGEHPQLLSSRDDDDLKQIVSALEKTAQELEQNERSPTRNPRGEKLRVRWRKLQNLCRDLQVIAIKQLHAVDLEHDEISTIRNIGKELAALEGYLSNSWLQPKDDAPRIVDIYHNPNVRKRLHAGTGRPLTLYILYPHEGRKMLCRGGVMTYYEHKSGKKLDNTDWIELLTSPNPPQRPQWTLPIKRKE